MVVPFERAIFKATTAVEGGQRVVYLHASTEARDLQGEKVLVSALETSIPYFLQYGRIDLDHASVTGEIRGSRVNPYAFEIGRPIDARREGDSIFVKAAIWSAKESGNRFTEAADLFWDSLQTNPPVVWYPSIAGDVFDEAPTSENGQPTQVIRGLRWHSIGLSRTPVNQGVNPVSTLPMRAFAKAFKSPSDIADFLTVLGAPHGARSAPVPTGAVKEDPNIEAALRVLATAEPAAGLDRYLDRASDLGIAPESALAVLMALLPIKGA